MKLDQSNSWLTLTANIGVITGIVFLGLKIQQNTAALQANSREAALESAMSSLFLAVGDPTLVLNRVRPELTEEEELKLSQYLSSLFQRGSPSARSLSLARLMKNVGSIFKRH